MLTRSTDREITGSGDIIYKPDWSKSKIGRNDKYQILETDITQIDLMVPVTEESLEKILTTHDVRYTQNRTTFIHRRDRKTGEEQQFLMTLVPDAECMESTGFEPFKNLSYGQYIGEFSGFILYYDIQGNFVSGWKCKDGKSVATLKWIPRDAAELLAKANVMNESVSMCSFEEIYIIPRYCYGSDDTGEVVIM